MGHGSTELSLIQPSEKLEMFPKGTSEVIRSKYTLHEMYGAISKDCTTTGSRKHDHGLIWNARHMGIPVRSKGMAEGSYRNIRSMTSLSIQWPLRPLYSQRKPELQAYL